MPLTSAIPRREFLVKSSLMAGVLALAGQAAPAADNKPKRKVLLIGDGIGKGLLARVKGQLKENLVTEWPAVNCGNTVDVIRGLPGWIKQHDPDLIHFHIGMEDVRSVYYGSYKSLVPLKEFGRNVDIILDMVYAISSKAVPVWSLITPVHDERVEAAKAQERDFTVFNDDIVKYNNQTLKRCKKARIQVNDLYTLMQQPGIDKMVEANGITPTAQAYDIMARTVSQRIESII